jgi:uncharacterized protein YicC (UPF0701 family)
MKIRALVALACGRGKIEIFIRVREHNAPVNIIVNRNAAKAYYEAIIVLAGELAIHEKPGLSTLLRMDGILELEKNRDDERYFQEIEPVLQEALKAFCL